MMLNLNKIREACKEYEKRYDDLPPSTWLLALVEELMQARAEIERLRALVPTAKLLRELANWSDDALPYSAAEALALARRIKEANTDDTTVDL